MQLIHTTTPSDPQIRQMKELVELCRSKNGLLLSFPEHMEHYWLVLSEGQLIGFLSSCTMYEGLWECTAFVHPDHRRRGIFTNLLEAVTSCSEALGEPELAFVTDNRCPDTLKTLKAMEAAFWYDEYMMEILLPDPDTDRTPPYEVPSSPIVWTEDELHFKGDTGVCKLACSGSQAYLYGLEIRSDLRGKGMGTAFLEALLGELPARGISLLRLQVAGDNLPALALYKKTGFRITETLSYYVY